ncbi:major facilitator superfamily domain-containing protein [Limtongia smithiae]|uniref:major facilitator superfamily domain-containing protein n=1 Tax=Limtongia smithiae TaxID=1125753 RepID=UPI0034CFB2A4
MGVISTIFSETGLLALIYASSDVHLLCFQKFVRMFAYGQVTIILALFFSALGIRDDKIGLLMTCTLLGDVVISFILTLVADKVGRRRVLGIGAILMAISGLIYSYSTNYWLLLGAAIIGVISPSGNEIGPFNAIEESIVAHLSDLSDRAQIYAWYTLLGSFGAALGTISSGYIIQFLQSTYNWTDITAYRLIFVLYSIIGVVKFACTLMLSPMTELEVAPEMQSTQLQNSANSEGAGSTSRSGDQTSGEAYAMQNMGKAGEDRDSMEQDDATDRRELLDEMNTWSSAKKRPKWLAWLNYMPHYSARTVRTVGLLILLFALDSFASGVATQTWVAYYFANRFEVTEATLGTLFFFTNMISAVSSLVAASISKRLGPIVTMVATHLPSSIVLSIIGFPSNVKVAMALLIIRFCTASMDKVPRQTFLSSIVTKEERTSVMGIVNVAKTLAQSGGPSVMGAFALKGIMKFGFLLAGLCKIVYDLSLLVTFLGVQLYNN